MLNILGLIVSILTAYFMHGYAYDYSREYMERLFCACVCLDCILMVFIYASRLLGD